MHNQAPSPIDGTPSASLRQALLVVTAGFLLAFALDPGSLGRWGYMLNDSSAIRPVQVAAEAASAAATGVWNSVGLPVPYDRLRDLSQQVRRMIGAGD